LDFFQIAWIALVVLVSLSWLWGRFSIARAAPAPPGQSVLDIEMEGVAARAVDEAQERYQVELNFSRASARLLDEKILETLHQRRTNKTLDDAEFSRNAMLWGAYLGEVMRREFEESVHWQRDSELGKETFPIVHTTGREIFPCGWCVKRVQKGPEEMVWIKLEREAGSRSTSDRAVRKPH
jgi:hypothetical protein